MFVTSNAGRKKRHIQGHTYPIELFPNIFMVLGLLLRVKFRGPGVSHGSMRHFLSLQAQPNQIAQYFPSVQPTRLLNIYYMHAFIYMHSFTCMPRQTRLLQSFCMPNQMKQVQCSHGKSTQSGVIATASVSKSSLELLLGIVADLPEYGSSKHDC